jgi:hypothetical protein
LDGRFLIELEDRDTVELGLRQGFSVPAGLLHGTVVPVRSAVLMYRRRRPLARCGGSGGDARGANRVPGPVPRKAGRAHSPRALVALGCGFAGARSQSGEDRRGEFWAVR